MEVSINDLSFKGQFESDAEARIGLKTIADISFASKKLTGNKPIRRTRSLASRPLIGKKTIEEFRIALFQSKKPEDQKLLTIILTNIVQGPFIEDSELNEELINFKSICGEPIGGGSIHAYLSKENGSINALISAKNLNEYNSPILEFSCSNGKKVTVFNFMTENCCLSYFRKYEANQKHLINENKMVAGKQHSKMDLSDPLAQECLNNGFQLLGNKYVYYFTNAQWYEFPQHSEGCYHGYPIGTPSNDATINRIKKVFGEPPYDISGYKFCVG